MNFFNEIFFFLPELYWLFIAIVILLLGVTLTESEHKIVFKHFGNLLIYTLSLYGYIYIQSPLVSYSLLNYQYTSDSFLSMIKLLIIFFLIFLVYVSSHYFFIERVFFFEYYFLVSIFCISLFFLISANDLILFYLIIELQALILYTLASIKKYNVFSAEAGLKYFVLGAFSSGLLLFGISFFYGFTGLTNFYDLKYLMLNMSESFVYIGLNLSVTFLLTAFLFKLAAAPFHLWVPDVYSGAPTAVVALFATLPKLAIFIFLIRFYTAIIADVGDLVYKFFIFSGIVSIIWGALAALNQFNIKRLYAYSAVANVGILLIALTYGTISSAIAVLNYLIGYIVSSLALFLLILLFRRHDKDRLILFIGDYNLWGSYSAVLSILAACVFFSFGGVPPLTGFFIKFFLFKTIFTLDFLASIIPFVGLFISVISAFYYIRVIRFAFFSVIRRPVLFTTVNPYLVFFLVLLCTFIFLFPIFQPTFFVICTNIGVLLFS